MSMAVLVCGGRDYEQHERVFAVLDNIHAKKEIICIVTGGAPGADAMAAKWAMQNEVKFLTVPAQWSKHGKAAGPLRNTKMLEDCHYLFVDYMVVAFPGGNGTADMVRQAKEKGVKVWKSPR